jgi:BirA family biotin operon repressor/biotin-[acetyl-CoA-carboxylase] ligase
MTYLNVSNPYKAPVYHEETVSSTMDVSRQLAAEGAPHGTVIVSDFQEKGRGRGYGRNWEMERGVNLPFTILLRYPRFEDIPIAITLRAGFAVSLAIEDFAVSLCDSVMVKWPNDIIIGSKKAAGILCEVDGGTSNSIVFLGIGINVKQREFPVHLRDKATSIQLEERKEKKEERNQTFGLEQLAITNAADERFCLLEKILRRLYEQFDTKKGVNWKNNLEKRLYKRGEQVVFIDGAAGSGKEIKGCLIGIGNSGELLILPDGEKEIRSFITGELSFYNTDSIYSKL